jgi:hypothetical protein
LSATAGWRVLIVPEGSSDTRRLRVLIEHLAERAGAVNRVRFVSFAGASTLSVHDIPKVARQLGLRPRYSPAGPNKGDGGTLRTLFQLLQFKKMLGPDLVVVWGRDDDGDSEKRDDAHRARQAMAVEAKLLLAIATQCGEAWVIAGWTPVDDDDHARWRALRAELGFDPCSYPERLSHKAHAPRSAKRVNEELCTQDHDREHVSLLAGIEAPAAAACGLRAFVNEVTAWLPVTDE